MLHARQDYNRIQDPENKIPADEPVFLLRAQDVCAIPALEAWIARAKAEAVDPRMVDAALAQVEKMRDWQAEHPVQVPDMP